MLRTEPAFGLPLHFLFAHSLGPLGLVGERLPGGLGAAATLAHMVERCRLRVRVRLGGARTKEVEVRATDDRSRHLDRAYSAASSSFWAWAGSPAAGESSAAL